MGPGETRRREIRMAKVIRTAALLPRYNKSFYGKAVVRTYSDGVEVLRSYKTDVLSRKPDGTLVRHWGDWSATTGRHIAAYCGVNKAAWDKMPVVPLDGAYRD